MVAPKFLAELQRLPDDVVSFQEAVNEVRAPWCEPTSLS